MDGYGFATGSTTGFAQSRLAPPIQMIVGSEISDATHEVSEQRNTVIFLKPSREFPKAVRKWFRMKIFWATGVEEPKGFFSRTFSGTGAYVSTNQECALLALHHGSGTVIRFASGAGASIEYVSQI